MNNQNTIFSMGFSVFADNVSNIRLNSLFPELLVTISPNSYGISVKDQDFRMALKNSDYLVLDGVFFSLASIVLNGKNIKKNQGMDVFSHFTDRLNKSNGKVFFLGSTNEILHKIKNRASKDFPNLEIGFYSPPYKNIFTHSDNDKMIEAVNKFQPDVLFVGMTCPKQEKWAFQNKNKIKTSLICCIGAVFDWYAGNQKNISPIWYKLRLVWLKRTIDRPEILKRYPNIGIFFWHLFLAILGNKKYKYGNF